MTIDERRDEIAREQLADRLAREEFILRHDIPPYIRPMPSAEVWEQDSLSQCRFCGTVYDLFDNKIHNRVWDCFGWYCSLCPPKKIRDWEERWRLGK